METTQRIPSRILQHCFGEGQAPVVDHSIGRHLIGICAVCREVVHLTKKHTAKAHGTWLYWGEDGYQARPRRRRY